MTNSFRISAFALLISVTIVSALPATAQVLPPGFTAEVVSDQFNVPTGFTFAPDGRALIIEKSGRVLLHDGATLQAQPVANLSAEVNDSGDRGLLGIALHPQWIPDGGVSSWVYLQYTVTPVPGEDWNWSQDNRFSFSRLTRYRSDTVAGNVVLQLATRQVLLAHQLPSGVVPDAIASCHSSHANGSLEFGSDGSLLVSNGDGAHFNLQDNGGNDAGCFLNFVHPETGKRGPLRLYEDSGSFRSQDLRSLAGKILRIDPETGMGYESNPWYDGNPASNTSRIWAMGLRNPFRFGVRPGTGASAPGSGNPGTIYVGDVGWNEWEETSVAAGGENFGWPCYEGMGQHPDYQSFERGADPLSRPDCNSLQVPVHTPPLLTWHHSFPGALRPPGFHQDDDGNPLGGFTGTSATGGAFYTGGSYPPEYEGRYFFGDYTGSWIRTLETDASDQLLAVRDFASGAESPVDFQRHPLNGDIYYLAIASFKLYRIRYEALP